MITITATAASGEIPMLATRCDLRQPLMAYADDRGVQPRNGMPALL
jgi:hypothetical protein